jgi:O-antigen ligase
VTVGGPGAGAPPLAIPPASRQPLPGQGLPRSTLWRAAFAGWRAHPLLGLGPDNFRHLYGRYLGRYAADDRLHANSLYFETLANLGIAGVLALIFLLVALARAARPALAAPPTRLLALGMGVGLCAYVAHGTLDYFFEFTPTYALFWLLAGTLVALGRPATGRRP